MTRSLQMLTAAVLTLAPAAAPASDAPSPLARVPASAVVVIHISGPDALEGHVAAFLKEVAPEQVAAATTGLESMFRGGEFDNNRKLLGLARDGHVFLAFFDGDIFVPTPSMAILLPITKYAEFRDGFLTPDERKTLKTENGYDSAMMNGQPAFLLDLRGYVAIATTKEAAEALAKKSSGLDGKLNKDQADRFVRSDLGVYLDGEALHKQFADPIKDAHKQIDDGIDAAEQGVGELQKAQWESLRGAADVLFQAADDGQAVLVVGELRPDGAALHAEAALKPESKTATLLKESRPSSFRDLARMPAGQILYTAWQAGPLPSKLFGPLQFGVQVGPDSEAANEALEAADRLAQAKPAWRLQAATVPPAGVEVWEYQDPQKAVAAETKLLGSLRAGDYYLYGLLRGKPEVEPKVVKYRTMDMTYAHLVFDADRMLSDVPEPERRPMIASLKKLYGDGVGFWFGSDGKVFVQATGRDWAAAKRQLDQYFASDTVVGKDESFAAVRRALPAETNALVVIDAVQFTGQVLDFFRPLAEASPGSGSKLPVVKGKPAFVGAALTLRPDRVEADLFVSSDAARQLYKPLGPYFPFLFFEF